MTEELMADLLINSLNGQVIARYKDMGDTTQAIVISAGLASGSGDDKILPSVEGTNAKFKNMGDGTYARVVYGV